MKLLSLCQDIAQLISSGQDARLSAADHARLRLHFVICQNCRTAAPAAKRALPTQGITR